ncbi:MAG: VOC family protein [Actinomycetota bacterium]
MVVPVQMTFDALDPNALCRWWAELLDYEIERDGDVVAGLIEQGAITDDQAVEIDGVLHLAIAASMVDPERVGPRFFFQQVPEEKVGKNRVHLDISVRPEDLEAEVARVTAVGATFVEFGSHPGHRWAVMRDPEGNEFCLH